MYEINKNISTISCAGTIIQQIGRKGNRENIFEAELSLARKWEKLPKSEKTADLLLYEKFMRSSINPFYEGLSRKCGLLFMKKCIMRGKGFRVSPWAYRSVITNESPVRIRNEELDNMKWPHICSIVDLPVKYGLRILSIVKGVTTYKRRSLWIE